MSALLRLQVPAEDAHLVWVGELENEHENLLSLLGLRSRGRRFLLWRRSAKHVAVQIDGRQKTRARKGALPVLCRGVTDCLEGLLPLAVCCRLLCEQAAVFLLCVCSVPHRITRRESRAC